MRRMSSRLNVLLETFKALMATRFAPSGTATLIVSSVLDETGIFLSSFCQEAPLSVEYSMNNSLVSS